MSFDPAGFAVRRWQFTLVAFALLTVLGLNLMGDGLRDMLDPRIRRAAR